jgi:hypothetical protein
MNHMTIAKRDYGGYYWAPYTRKEQVGQQLLGL